MNGANYALEGIHSGEIREIALAFALIGLL